MKLLDQCCSMENDYLREHGGVLYPKLEETLSALKEKVSALHREQLPEWLYRGIFRSLRIWKIL